VDTLFLQILNMSITASYVILFVIAVRLLLKKAPKIFSYALWSVVLFRLVSPFSFDSIFSLIPVKTQTVPTNIMYSQTPEINSGITVMIKQ
jgi:beta-lactamase regulating signal transducer with metallopeptidase domain